MRIEKTNLHLNQGNINHVSIVMKEKDQPRLGEDVRNIIGDIYQGLPVDEPNFKFFHISPKQFSGFSRHSEILSTFKMTP